MHPDNSESQQFQIPEIQHFIDLASQIATQCFDGHYTLFSFTTGYKFIFGTPNDVRLDLAAVGVFPTIETAIANAISRYMDDYIRSEVGPNEQSAN